jgi:2-oxoisovalerate dehydrogenase E1 component alpha subunit
MLRNLTKRLFSVKQTDFFTSKFTEEMQLIQAQDKIKCFRVMDENGKVISPKYDTLSKDLSLKIFGKMIQINECDKRFNMAQREGKISFYMTCTGEEGSTVASAAALSNDDLIYPQYREPAVLLWRGFTIQQMAHQLTGNCKDIGKGRQMPVHYGSREFNYQTVSSPLCTQVPQASGAGYHYRVKNLNKICITYFGEGAASEGDFHSALNFASTLRSQTLFFCRNNMYAISTPIDDQYNGDGIAARGIAYGIPTIRIDGNDVLAVYNAVKHARELIVTEKKPVVIEAMSYRVGDHSTSDSSKAYRNEKEMQKWHDYLKKIGNPITRFYNYMKDKNWIGEKELKEIEDNTKEEVRDSLKKAFACKKPSLDSMFEDVYEQVPPNLIEQKENLKSHILKYQDAYNLDSYSDK